MIASIDLFRGDVTVIEVCDIRLLPNPVTCCFLYFSKIDVLSVYPESVYKDKMERPCKWACLILTKCRFRDLWRREATPEGQV